MTDSALFPNIHQRRVATNGLQLNIAEQQPQGEVKDLVIMCHGFPESWYSWRHQFAPLPHLLLPPAQRK